MSTKTTFKRIALVAVAALGLGLLSTGPSQAAISGETLTATASATSITTGDSVTITVTNEWTSSSTADTRSIGVDSTTTGTGAIQAIYAKTSNDTVNAQVGSGAAVGVAYRIDSTTTQIPRLTETATPAAGPARYNKVVTTLMLQNFSKAGSYYITVYSASSGAGPTTATAVKTVNFTITVTDGAPVGANVYVSSDTNTGSVARGNFGATTADTAIAASAGTAAAPKFVGYMFPVVLTGSPADSKTAGGTNFCSTQSANATLGVSAGYCAVSVTVSGPGLIVAGALGGTPAKSATMSLSNNGTDAMSSSDTLVVYSDGTSGTGTVTFTMGSVTLATKTLTFYGAASTITPYFVDTVVSIGASQTAVKALVKDSGGNKLAGTTKVYAFSSDTKVISDSGTACSYDTTYAMHSCSLTFVDTGTATITLRDASGVAASTIASTALSFTVRGTKVASVTASFDKATYAPGEKAILTVVTKDLAGSFMDATTVSNAYTISTNRDAGSSSNVSTSSTPLLATDGVETRVVYMPVTGGVFEYKFTAGSGSVAAANGGWTSVTASANVADPTKDAADAATDAALEATDAAYAAQDAAQLAAESADAATAAAEAATAAAEAATAAVEDLATKVAGLFADLQKQITTLANVVAKIAKKVKA